jgi:TRAP transporter 4TM/12TM fusion protein
MPATKLPAAQKPFFDWIATAIVAYHVVIVGNLAAMAGFFIPDQVHGAISLASALTIIFFLIPAGGTGRGATRADEVEIRRRTAWFDYIPIAATWVSLGYVVVFYQAIVDYSMFGFLDAKGQVLALLICLPLIEAVRRTTGITLPILVGILVLATIFQNVLPGILYGRGYEIDRLLYAAYVGESGIFGLPLRVAAQIIIIFVAFGALMEQSGAGRWFLRLALAATGRSYGGPAKAAVIASALFGSISGSPSANVATIGVFTIPLMKQIGYKPAFAGAVEAVSSTGGQILPPVMGAIAFVMAEWIRVPYTTIAAAAAVPASLYFIIVFFSVHLQARRSGIRPMQREELPKVGQAFREGWFYLIPIAMLVYFLLIKGYPPGMAGVLTFPFVIGASFLSSEREDWLLPGKLMKACTRAVRGWVTIAAITGFVGIMIGAIELSGIGVKISTAILDLAGGNLILVLLLVGLASFVLGMGLDSIPVYITLATLTAPALTQLGVSQVAAHLYVIYWGLASFFTPPLCIAVFVSIAISGSTLWETGWEAVRLGIAAFIIPIAFVLDEGLLLHGSAGTIVLAIATAFVGACLLACGLQGFAFAPLPPWRRIFICISGLLLIGPGWILPLTGAALAAVTLVRLGKHKAIETAG